MTPRLPEQERLDGALPEGRKRLERFVQATGCAAPFTQMLIAWGIVSCCCYQDRTPLGDLRTTRLKDIWNGDNMRNLRRKLLDGIPLGVVDSRWRFERERGMSSCAYCGHFAPSDLNSPNRERSCKSFNPYYSDRSPPGSVTLGHLPDYVEFKYTMLCNMECPMCFDWWKPAPVKRNAPGISARETSGIYGPTFWQDLSEFIAAASTVAFLGGEPFLQPEVSRTLDLVREINPTCQARFVTNLSPWGERVKTMLNPLPSVGLAISLESAVPATYEFFRYPARFDRFSAALDDLNLWRLERYYESGASVPLTAIVTLTALTLQDIVPTLIWLKERSVQTIAFNVAFQPLWRSPAGFVSQPQENADPAELIPISPALLSSQRRTNLLEIVAEALGRVRDREVKDVLGFTRRIVDPSTERSLSSALSRIANSGREGLPLVRSPP